MASRKTKKMTKKETKKETKKKKKNRNRSRNRNRKKGNGRTAQKGMCAKAMKSSTARFQQRETPLSSCLTRLEGLFGTFKKITAPASPTTPYRLYQLSHFFSYALHIGPKHHFHLPQHHF
jgi:hypothetical protein